MNSLASFATQTTVSRLRLQVDEKLILQRELYIRRDTII